MLDSEVATTRVTIAGQDIDLVNNGMPVGTPVRYWPGVREGEGRESITRTPVWMLHTSSGDIPLVSVEGYPGGIALTHVEVL